MPKKTVVADAWDDDWENQAGAAVREEEQQPAASEQEAPLTKAERLAQHAESNRKLWESAESPQEFHFLAASSISNNVPLATDFKPAMKVLSRKPAPKMVARRDPVTGVSQLSLQEDDEDDEEKNRPRPTPEEIRLRQQRELEEKQRRYDEARAKIFGESALSSGSSTPGNVTPPQPTSEAGGGGGRQNYRGRGRGRGGRRNDSYNSGHGRQDGADRRPASSQAGTRELFDPNFSPKPGSMLHRRGGDSSPSQCGRSTTPREEDQVIRAPKGPDGSGRGGFGFARRGAKGG